MAESYCYKNAGDTVRVRIFLVINDDDTIRGWDFDSFLGTDIENWYTYATLSADYFPTKREAKKYVTELYGKLTSITIEDDMVEGWDM